MSSGDAADDGVVYYCTAEPLSHYKMKNSQDSLIFSSNKHILVINIVNFTPNVSYQSQVIGESANIMLCNLWMSYHVYCPYYS